MLPTAQVLMAMSLAKAVQLGLSLWLLRTPGDRVIRLTVLAGAALALYDDDWSYPRGFMWLPLGVWLACVTRFLSDL